MSDENNNVKQIKDLDVYEIFRQMELMRQEGIAEEDLRKSVLEFLDERQGNFRKPLKRIIKTAESLPIPSQADINKMYEDDLVVKNAALSSEMQYLLEKVMDGTPTFSRVYLPPVRPKSLKALLKMYTYRFLYFTLTKFTSLIVWTLTKAGIK